ncbi:MAG: MFS transporter [Planctomycetes bacterium]|nr:MFS transporter [Planctomycetota bacterium]
MSTPVGLTGHLIACAVGAALDNLYRMVVVTALVSVAYRAHAGDSKAADAAASGYSSLAMILFTLPFIVLAPLAGSLGDRLPKQLIVRAARIADVPICALAIVGFATGSVPLLFSSFVALGIASAFFAPVKLAIVPELATPGRLARANAALAAVTVASILVGSCLSAVTDAEALAWLARSLGFAWPEAWVARAPIWALSLLSGALCVLGIVGAFRVPAVRAQSPGTRLAMPWAVTTQVSSMARTRGIIAPAIALAGFWALGGAAVVGLIPLAKGVYGLAQAGTVQLFLALVVGVIVGSVATPRWMAKAFPAGLPIVGAALAGFALACVGWHAETATALPIAERSQVPAAVWLFLCGVGAGLWEVPLTIILQERSPAEKRNQIMAGVSVLGSFGTFFAAGAYWLLANGADRSPAQVFVILGLGTLALAVGFALWYRLQLAAWLMASIVTRIWRVRVIGAEHVPSEGGCLVICNHLSFADGVVLGSSLPRPGRFLVYRRYVEMPVIGFLLRAAGVIPVAGEDKRRALLASIDAAVESAKSGQCVVIFPEGKITRSGQTDSFRSGLERIAGRAQVPVVPAYLHGLWGSPLSRAPRRDLPRLWRRLELRIGPPLPSTTTAGQARNHVMHLSFDHAHERARRDRRTLASAFIAAAKRRPFANAVQDAGGAIANWKLAAVARSLVPLLELTHDDRTIGIVLPPGRGGAIVNVALALARRTAVNLNHTAGPAQVTRMCELARIRTIVTSRLYLRRIGEPDLPGRIILVEDLLPRLGTLTLMRHALAFFTMPARWLARGHGDDTAAIVFSSGSTGDPKGVELTHRQILANCASVADGLDLHRSQDVILSPLPLFHSFGLIPGMWLGLATGMTVASQPDPSDAKALGELAQSARATFLISTPTFARGYLRRVEPEQFKTLRFAVVGAERCPADLRKQFKERFGSELLEGYGCTELAPTVATNLIDVHRDGEREVRARDGSVGRALPGQQVFAVDPVTHEPLPPGSEGLLVVRSPSRMKGYLDRPDLTAKAFVAGGYNTGDIGRVDEDGFIFITGRLARFAKIGGEMVPLDNVETALQTVVGDICEIAVAAIPDESRGERLIVLHTGYTGSIEDLLASLDGLPALWRPKPRDVRPVEAIPKLGTGKRDLAGITALAVRG